MMMELKDMDYEARLKETGLMSLEVRRCRADLLEVYKIMHGMENLNPSDFFQLRGDEATTRGHRFTIYKQRFNLMLRRFCFSNRVVDLWNSLKDEAVAARTLNEFKRHIDPMLKQKRGLTTSQRRLPVPVTRVTDPSYIFYM